MTNETKVFERPDIVKKEASGYEDIYNRIYKNNFNAFHKKNGFALILFILNGFLRGNGRFSG